MPKPTTEDNQFQQQNRLTFGGEKQQIQLELLKAFDRLQQSQSTFYIKQTLPKGIIQKKLPHREKLLKNKFNSQHQKTKSSRKLLLLKAIQQTSNTKIQNKPYSYQHHTDRSLNSKTSLSCAKSYHHNKRKRLMTEFYEQKQTQKLVKRLLNVQPHPEVKKQLQLQSYNRHVKVKNIMMHRVDDQPVNKQTIILKKSNGQSIIVRSNKKKNHNSRVLGNKHSRHQKQSKNTIELKEKDLQRFLKEEKKKSRQFSLLDKLKSPNQKNKPELFMKRKKRIKTQEPQIAENRQLYKIPSMIEQRNSEKLPKIVQNLRVQSTPVYKGHSELHKYLTPMNSLIKNYY